MRDAGGGEEIHTVFKTQTDYCGSHRDWAQGNNIRDRIRVPDPGIPHPASSVRQRGNSAARMFRNKRLVDGSCP
jgi:hypothetical protein